MPQPKNNRTHPKKKKNDQITTWITSKLLETVYSSYESFFLATSLKKVDVFLV
jgi:hypothetical protein